jgi:hypothetical protein
MDVLASLCVVSHCTLTCRRLLCVNPFCGLAATGSDAIAVYDDNGDGEDNAEGDENEDEDDDEENETNEAGIGLACVGDGAGGGAKSVCEVTAYCRVTVRVACGGEKFFKCPVVKAGGRQYVECVVEK